MGTHSYLHLRFNQKQNSNFQFSKMKKIKVSHVQRQRSKIIKKVETLIRTLQFSSKPQHLQYFHRRVIVLNRFSKHMSAKSWDIALRAMKWAILKQIRTNQHSIFQLKDICELENFSFRHQLKKKIYFMLSFIYKLF